MDKIDLSTLENNCNWKNYLGDLPLIPPTDLTIDLTFPPIGGSFLRISKWWQASGARGRFLDLYLVITPDGYRIRM
jgi:hypothetical protein